MCSKFETLKGDSSIKLMPYFNKRKYIYVLNS
jgi:hypothetical protein